MYIDQLPADFDFGTRTPPREALRRAFEHEQPRLPSVKFRSLGELMLALASAGGGRAFSDTPDGASYCRSVGGWANRALGDGLNETVGSDGGVLVAPQLAADLLYSAYEDPLLSRTTVYTPRGNRISVPGVRESSRATGSRAGGITSHWRSEAAEAEASKASLELVQLTLDSCEVYIRATSELAEDSEAFGRAVAGLAGKELAFRLAERIIRGRPPTPGLLGSPSLLTVPKESGQAADTLTYPNVVNMLRSLFVGCWKRGVFLHEPRLVKQLLELVSPTGSAVYRPGPPPQARLLGFPCLPSELCYPLGDSGDIFLLDPSTIVCALKGFSSASFHLYFLSNEAAFRIQARFDSNTFWLSQITTYNGDSASNIVALEARA